MKKKNKQSFPFKRLVLFGVFFYFCMKERKMERKQITIRSYSRCFRDGIAYVLRHFSHLLWILRYVLPPYVLSFVLLVIADDGLSLRLQAQPGDGHHFWVFFAGVAVAWFMLLDVGLQAVLVAYQKRTCLNRQAEDTQEPVLGPSASATYLRVLLANLVRGGMAFVVFLSFVFLMPHLSGLALSATVVALLVLALLFLMGVSRLFYMKYAYDNDGFRTSLSDCFGLFRYLGRTITVELLSFWVVVAVVFTFGAPFFIMRHIITLAALTRLAGEPASLPGYAMVLYYVCIAIFALGMAFASLLISYPVCMNWQSIKALEEEGGK